MSVYFVLKVVSLALRLHLHKIVFISTLKPIQTEFDSLYGSCEPSKLLRLVASNPFSCLARTQPRNCSNLVMPFSSTRTVNVNLHRSNRNKNVWVYSNIVIISYAHNAEKPKRKTIKTKHKLEIRIIYVFIILRCIKHLYETHETGTEKFKMWLNVNF